MKKSKRSVGFIFGCIVLSVLLTFSGVSVGIVTYGAITADELDNDVNNNQVNGFYDYGNTQNNVIIQDSNGNTIVVPENGNNGYVNNGTQNNNNPVVNNGNPNQNTGVGNQNSTPNVIDFRSENKTKQDIVDIYALVMNKAKADKPGFTKIEYQELPGGAENRVVAEGSEKVTEEDINKLMGFIEGLDVFVPKEEAEKEPYVHEKGDADMTLFPVFFREKGSYLTDPNAIESYTYTVLPNGNVKMTFVLVSEDNPEPIAENATVSPSYTGAVFAPMSKARIDGTVYHPIVTVFAKDIEYSLRYHDCSVELEFNPDTLQVVNVNQYCNVSIKGSGDVVGIGFVGLERQELLSTVIIKDFKY